MTELLGVDSAATIPIGPARAAGYTVICGYICRGQITKAYIDQVFASGGIFLPIYETDGTPDGYDDGTRQGANAAAELNRLSYGWLGCLFTDDVSGAPLTRDEDWCRGLSATFHAHRVFYGPSHIGRALVGEGLMGSTMPEGAFSYSVPYTPGQPPPRTPDQCGIQWPKYVYPGGTQCDYDVFWSTPWDPRTFNPITITPAKDWFDMATKEDLEGILMSDAFLTAVAKKVKQGLDGTLRQQLENTEPDSPFVKGQDLLSVRDDINTVTLDQLDPNRQPPGPRPSPDAKPVRDFIERIP